MHYDKKPSALFAGATAGICLLLELVLFMTVVVPATLISLPFLALTRRKSI